MAEEDVHQCRLARTILTQQTEDFTLRQFKRNPVIGNEGAKTFGDVLQVEDGLAHDAIISSSPFTGEVARNAPEGEVPHPAAAQPPSPQGGGMKRSLSSTSVRCRRWQPRMNRP